MFLTRRAHPFSGTFCPKSRSTHAGIQGSSVALRRPTAPRAEIAKQTRRSWTRCAHRRFRARASRARPVDRRARSRAGLDDVHGGIVHARSSAPRSRLRCAATRPKAAAPGVMARLTPRKWPKASCMTPRRRVCRFRATVLTLPHRKMFYDNAATRFTRRLAYHARPAQRKISSANAGWSARACIACERAEGALLALDADSRRRSQVSSGPSKISGAAQRRDSRPGGHTARWPANLKIILASAV